MLTPNESLVPVYSNCLLGSQNISSHKSSTSRSPNSPSGTGPTISEPLNVKSSNPNTQTHPATSSSDPIKLLPFSLLPYHLYYHLIVESRRSLFYLVSWFVLNAAITLYCKTLFSQDKFPYPMLMTAIHLAFTLVGIWCLQRLQWHIPKPLAPEMRFTILWFSVLFTVNIWLSNAALSAVSVSLHQVLRTFVPLTTMGICTLFFKEVYPLSLLPSVLLVIGGVALTVWGDFEESPFVGILISLLGCTASSLKGVITQRTQAGSLGLDALDLLRYLCPLACIQLLFVASLLGETSALLSNTNVTASLVGHLSCLGCVAFGLNVTSFRCAGLFNPLTLNIVGNVKQVLTGLLSIALTGGTWSTAIIVGIFGTAVGATWYSVEMHRWKTRHDGTPGRQDDEDLEEQAEDRTCTINSNKILESSKTVELKEKVGK